MKKAVLFSLLALITINLSGQSLIGAWEAIGDFKGKKLRSVVIFTDKYQVGTFYDAETGAFMGTNGGAWNIEESTIGDTIEFNISEIIEFDTENPDRVGSTNSFNIELEGNELRIKGAPMVWKRIDDGSPGALAGAWLISGRMRDGEIQKRDTNRPRKTMKILSGTRFQWIAYNTETEEFMGTGGGTYTTVDGKYTENIEFFSRDDARVGASLQFDYELKDGDWHHSGLSSKGQPIHEIWNKRE